MRSLARASPSPSPASSCSPHSQRAPTPQGTPGLHATPAQGQGGRGHSPSEPPHGSGVGPSPAAGAAVPPQGSTGGPAGAAGLQGSPEAGVGAGPPQGSAAGGTGGPPQGSEVGAAAGRAAAMGTGPPQGSAACGAAGAVKTSARSMRDDCREGDERRGSGADPAPERGRGGDRTAKQQEGQKEPGVKGRLTYRQGTPERPERTGAGADAQLLVPLTRSPGHLPTRPGPPPTLAPPSTLRTAVGWPCNTTRPLPTQARPLTSPRRGAPDTTQTRGLRLSRRPRPRTRSCPHALDGRCPRRPCTPLPSQGQGGRRSRAETLLGCAGH